MANYINKIISLLSSFIILFFIATEFPTLSSATSNETDLQALLDFKNHIQSDPSQFLNSWNDSIHFCDWQGITCGKRHKRVTVLNVSSLDLVGTLSPSIGNFSFLRKIYLYNNSFQGIIPHEIGRLYGLQSLVLLNNSFQGELPADITLCKNLQFLQLGGNNLSGRIPHQLGALSNLYYLGLGKNNFIGNIPTSLGNISTLTLLDISENNLSGNIPRELGKLFNLQLLYLGLNKLSGSFPTEIYNISTIQVLSIPFNFLTGQFPDTLGLTLPKMTIFQAESNNFTGSIPSTLANASDLAIIDIGYNMLTGPIPQNLGRLQQLQRLIFDNNPLGIDRDNDISIFATLTNCTNLEVLSFAQIGIGGIMPLEISNLSRKLTYFRLDDNHISGNLPEGVGELVGLSMFSVRNNILSGNIPISIGKLINLKQLYLYENKFIGEIPPSIGDISGLLILSLSQNTLTGSIPVSLSNLTQLEALALDQNQLNGSLPKEVFSLTSLSQGLYLDENKFTGSLPLEVGDLIHLVWLSVSRNELSDEIPITIGDCQMLVHLELEGNLLNGMIPSSLGQLKSIEVIDLSQNKLSGKIPVSLETLKFISFLDLSINMLEGEVPRNGVFSNESALSIVGNEKLCGGIKSLNLHDCPPNNHNHNPGDPPKKHGKLSTHIIIIPVICIFIAMVSLYVCTYTMYQTRKSERVPSSTSAHDEHLFKISYTEILKSTNGFSSENLIGEGKYGAIYRAVLKPCEKVVAVKVLKLQLKGAHQSFLAECKALRNIRHRNLVNIITSCSSIDFKGNDFKALVLEYIPNGSLEEWLHYKPFVVFNEKKLDLLERLNIAIDIATALDYLHNNSGNPIVHCDIKPSNVLLGDDLRGLVSDFGLAKFLPMANEISHDIESTSIGIRGTIGYVAPEYGMGGDVSAKGDIYSYGILLLEMFTGKRPTDTIFTEDFNLHNYVKIALGHHAAEIVDPRLLMVEDTDENRRIKSCCLSVLRVGVLCSSQMQNKRMDIKDALNALQHIRLAVDKSCLVSSRGSNIGEAWRWMLDWRRELRGWEYGELVDLINMLSSRDLNADIVDAPEWTLNTNVTFSVSSLEEMLINAMENLSTRSATIPSKWNSWIPSKVNIHYWRANLDRLPTRKNLAMMNIHVADVTCPFCKTADEDSPHLFLHCDFAQHIWKKVFGWCSVSISSSMSWGDFCSFHPSWLSSDKAAKKIWDAIRKVVLWVVWLRRNDVIFHSKITTTEEVFLDIQCCSFRWIVGRNVAITTTWEDWLNKPL